MDFLLLFFYWHLTRSCSKNEIKCSFFFYHELQKISCEWMIWKVVDLMRYGVSTYAIDLIVKLDSCQNRLQKEMKNLRIKKMSDCFIVTKIFINHFNEPRFKNIFSLSFTLFNKADISNQNIISFHIQFKILPFLKLIHFSR